MSRGAPDYTGMKVDVVLRPEWAAKEGTDKTFHAVEADVAFNIETSAVYIVPAGKKLYIIDFAFIIVAFNAADGDLPQIGYMDINDVTSGVTFLTLGGNGGGGMSLAVPIVIPGGHAVAFAVTNFAFHNVLQSLSAHGYEI